MQNYDESMEILTSLMEALLLFLALKLGLSYFLEWKIQVRIFRARDLPVIVSHSRYDSYAVHRVTGPYQIVQKTQDRILAYMKWD